MGYASSPARALGATGDDVHALFAQWSALHDQAYALQQAGKDVPADLWKQMDALQQQLDVLQNPDNPDAPVHRLTVTPAIAAQYFHLTVSKGDGGAAYNAALDRWASSGTFIVFTNPDGSPGGFAMTDAPPDVQQAFATLFGKAIYQSVTTGIPTATPSAPAAPAAPARYLVAGISFADDGTVYDSAGNPTGEQLSQDDVHALLTTGALAPKAITAKVDTSPAPKMISDTLVNTAADIAEQAGVDLSQPFSLVDRNTGNAVAVIKQLPTGELSVKTPTSAHDLAGVVTSVTGFIDDLAGTINGVGTEVQKIGNAIKGGAAGAQAGYNTPTNWTPYLAAGGVGLALLLLRHR